MEKAQAHSILVVDDEPSVLRMLEVLLRRDGHEVRTATNPDEALAALAERPAEIVLSDNVMPGGMDGTALLAHVESQYPETVRLLMTAEPNTGALSRAINEGHVFRYIAKPFTPQAIKDAILAAVHQCQLVGENRRLQEVTRTQNQMLWDLTFDLEKTVEQRTTEIESQKRLIEESHQRLIELTAQRADMLLILAHELNTPLAVIRGFLELLKDNNKTWDPEKRLQILDLLGESLERLDRNVGSILQTIDAGSETFELRREPFDLREVVRDCSRGAQPLIERRRHRFTLDLGKEPLPVRAERGLIRNVIDNLLLNAIRFTPDGGQVSITARNGGPWVEVTVKDSGVGIPPERQEKIFERFYEGADPMHHSSGHVEFGSGSLGLGLAVSKSIADRHQGEIRVASQSGRGSSFTLRLPADPP